jgi:hypothetical protein
MLMSILALMSRAVLAEEGILCAFLVYAAKIDGSIANFADWG